MEQASINIKNIEEIAKVLEKLKVSSSHKNRHFITFKAKREKKILCYLFSAAICHQTHSLINKDKNLVGWNYLEHVFSTLAEEDSKLLEVEYINIRSSHQLTKELEVLFPESQSNPACTLDRLPERAALLKNIAKVLEERYDSRVENLLDRSELKLYNAGHGLYDLLSVFDAFKDPLKKKSSVFLKFLCESGLCDLKDKESFEPMMDYHMQRLLLRTGCVEILDTELKEMLKQKKLLASDIEIREKCVDAIRVISTISGMSVLDLDDIFWALGRSCCNQKLLCRDGQCSKRPCTLTSILALERHQQCLFHGVCQGNRDSSYQEFWEPQVKTFYY